MAKGKPVSKVPELVEPKEIDWRTMLVALTPEEIQERGKLMAEKVMTVIREEAKLAVIATNSRALIKEADESSRSLAKIIASGQEERSVECHVVRSLETLSVTVVRNDTGEVVAGRPMSHVEEMALRQSMLPGVESKES